MNEVYTIRSEEDDEYKLQFTTNRSGVIADAILDKLESEGISVVEIGLERTKGQSFTNHRVLAQIEQCIADVILTRPNVMLTFFCDFISLLPTMKKDMAVQEYRSRLFSRMFERYVEQHHIDDVFNRVTVVEGMAENYYFHVIARRHHLVYADMISVGIQKDYGKPSEE